jgi:hypothetical protein
MKSKTVKFNLFMLFTAIMLIAGWYMNVPGIPSWLFLVLVIVGWLTSQAITFFKPSGEFIGSGQNWTVGKWLMRIGTSVLAIFSLMENSGIGAAVAALLTPLIEIIVRIYGSDTDEQKAANAVSRARGY